MGPAEPAESWANGTKVPLQGNRKGPVGCLQVTLSTPGCDGPILGLWHPGPQDSWEEGVLPLPLNPGAQSLAFHVTWKR